MPLGLNRWTLSGLLLDYAVVLLRRNQVVKDGLEGSLNDGGRMRPARRLQQGHRGRVHRRAIFWATLRFRHNYPMFGTGYEQI